MKKILRITAFSALLVAGGCMEHLDETRRYDTLPFQIKLNYPADSRADEDGQMAKAGVKVTMTNTASNAVFEAATDAAGVATFTLVPGQYIASVTDKRADNGVITLFNGALPQMNLSKNDANKQVSIDLQKSKTSQILIKEFYFGGCPDNNGSKTFQNDKYVILYNNSDVDASIGNLCLGVTNPTTAANNNNDYVDGKLIYDLGEDSWIPAGYGMWKFQDSQKEVVIPPYGQIVIALYSAIKHTETYNNSVDLIDPSYYVTYHEGIFDKAPQHSTPYATIPFDHYLRAIKISGSNVWVVAANSPAFFIFSYPKDSDFDLLAYADNLDNINYYGNKSTASNKRIKIPVDWVLDGIEVFVSGGSTVKRLLSTVDAGTFLFKNGQGYTAYRNVDAEATRAIPGNAEKLVYGYQYGTMDVVDGSTDPSGIDAEASLRNGARIVYQDTNNSSADFHMRRQASLRDNM